MAVTDLLSQNENEVLKELQANIERNPFDISDYSIFPMEIGKIYPIYSRKMLPSDHFKITANLLLRQLQPMLVPQMSSFKLITAYYYLDYRVAFPQIEQFFANQQGQTNIDLPYLVDPQYFGEPQKGDFILPKVYSFNDFPASSNERPHSTSHTKYSNLDNLRSFLKVTSNSCNEKVDPMPFYMYQRVFRDFYLPLDRIDFNVYNAWFPTNPQEFTLKQGANIVINSLHQGDGTHTESLYADLTLTKIRTHTVRDDYFTSTYPRPLRGNVPSLQGATELPETDGQMKLDLLVDDILQNELTSIFNDFTLSEGGTRFNSSYADLTFESIDSSNLPRADKIFISGGSNGTTRDATGIHFTGDEFTVKSSNYNLLKDRIVNKLNQFNNAKFKFNDLTLNFNLTEQTLRVLRQNTRWREAMMLSKPTIKNYVRSIYGQNIGEDVLQGPIFIGGTSQDILINEIEQSVATDTTPLGSQGATAMSLSNNYVGDIYSRFFGWVLGVAYILPSLNYEPGIPREMQERTPEDWFNPYFTHLSMQAVLNKELFVSNDDDWNNHVLGYNGIYDNYRMGFNTVAGGMIDPPDDIKLYTQTRRFTDNNKPEITFNFLDSSKAISKQVFSVPSIPPFILQAVSRVKAIRPLPANATPK